MPPLTAVPLAAVVPLAAAAKSEVHQRGWCHIARCCYWLQPQKVAVEVPPVALASVWAVHSVTVEVPPLSAAAARPERDDIGTRDGLGERRLGVRDDLG